jgi:riboflavin synthase
LFTGIVEEVGSVQEINRSSGETRVKIKAINIVGDLRVGDSVMVNGACLTVTEVKGDAISFDISGETILRTNFVELRSGSAVNLERALKVSDRIGGHYVTGHIDGTAEITSFHEQGGSLMLTVDIGKLDRRLVVEKGSIAIDGISLTVARQHGSMVEVAIIPYTLNATNLKARKPGDKVNVELDIFAKYAIKALARENDLSDVNDKEARLLELLDNY